MKNKKTWFIVSMSLIVVLMFTFSGCTTEEVVRIVEVEVPGETIVEIVEVPGETIVESVEVQVAGPAISFWSFENQPDRAEKTLAIIDEFTKKTGISVSLILIDQSSMNSIMAANYAAGTLPDVVFVPLTLVGDWYNDGILDVEAATDVIEDLDVNTFSQSPLSMVTVDNGYAAVPSDGWGQLLIYRTDLFDAFSLEPPVDYDKIMIAAETLEENGYIGIMAGTDPGHSHTQSTFEQFALANGVSLADEEGNITLNTPALVNAIQFYTNLMMNFGPKDTSTYWMQSRATYLAGRAGMVSWSPFILDELAGLVDSSLPNCPECADDPTYLAKNSDFVAAFSGPDGEPVQFGKANYMGITTGANTDAAKQFVIYMLNEGYLTWLGVAAEGKFPMRVGTTESPNLFIDGWSQLDVGVDRRAPLGEFYNQDALDLIVRGANDFTMLGIFEGQMELVSAIYTEMVFPRNIGEVMEGYLTPEEAAANIQSEVEELQANLSK